ncbi:MAG: Glycosyltransferase (Modular protein) [candidate division CPR1 bacterium GW2011_GWA2_42_17]|uniref:Glycosyltransferase (Modular protein) n=1 Tax=candidate division CPR1 bacterium GW2011_GWA2_42_17 TaxID=1618341 RepID=A0A0G0Z717_9BACT|nr:MAG: Glycosyltransferase (Modular protein) [candidate division CPR1 bacterium GW2011_GWA2_42_17]
MKIVHISNVWPPYVGGQGKAALEQARALYDLGEDISVVTLDNGQEKNDYPWPVYYLKPKIRLGLSGIFYVGLDSILKGADIIQLHWPSFGLDLGLLWYSFRHRRKKIVIFYHMDPVASGLTGVIFFIWQRTILPLIIARSKMIVGATVDYLKHSLVWTYARECHKVCQVIPYGVGAEFFTRDVIARDKPYFLSVGSLDKQHQNKNLRWLLEVWAQAGLCHRAEWLIIGDGALRSAYENYAKNINAHGAVFLGRVGESELPKYFAGALATILPAKSRTEAFGLVQLESLAGGTPVIVQDIWGVREVAQTFGGECGFINPIDDSASLISLMQFILEKRPRFKGNMAELKGDWSWARQGEKLLEMYRSL